MKIAKEIKNRIDKFEFGTVFLATDFADTSHSSRVGVVFCREI